MGIYQCVDSLALNEIMVRGGGWRGNAYITCVDADYQRSFKMDAGQLDVDLAYVRSELERTRSHLVGIYIGVFVITVATVASVWHHW
jgi:hypothetical protein